MSTTIRQMTIADIPAGMRLKELAGWNQTTTDWHRFFRLQSDGWFAAEVDGEFVGTVAAFIFGNVAWIALVLVDPEYRRHGIGTALMNRALTFTGQRTVRLDATPLGRPIYEKLEFSGEYELTRYAGVLTSTTTTVTKPDSLEIVTKLDLQTTATPRARLLEALAAENGATTRVVNNTGYLMDRPGSHATHIGPAIAIDDASGLALFNDAARRLAGRPVFLDIPVANRPAIAWAEAAGLKAQRNFLRMRRGPAIAEQPHQIWASSGPEKG